MFCYNCGTDCKEDRFCFNCGCRVGKPEEREKIYPDPPLGVYTHSRGFLEIQRQCVRINIHTTDVSYDYCVPFEDIEQLRFVAATACSRGFLEIGRKGGLNMLFPTPSVFMNYETVGFAFAQLAIFEKLFEFLNRCAQINNESDAKNE